LADKLLQEGGSSVALVLAMLFKNFVGKLGAGLESKLLGEDEGVVAVEEDCSGLRTVG
jgi:hypothetical protein